MSREREVPHDLTELARKSLANFALQNSDSQVITDASIKALRKMTQQPETNIELKIFQQDVVIHRS